MPCCWLPYRFTRVTSEPCVRLFRPELSEDARTEGLLLSCVLCSTRAVTSTPPRGHLLVVGVVRAVLQICFVIPCRAFLWGVLWLNVSWVDCRCLGWALSSWLTRASDHCGVRCLFLFFFSAWTFYVCEIAFASTLEGHTVRDSSFRGGVGSGSRGQESGQSPGQEGKYENAGA